MPDRTCSIDGCERPHCARGWCTLHYQRNTPPKQTGPCSVEGCDAPNHAKGLCAKHRARVKAARQPRRHPRAALAALSRAAMVRTMRAAYVRFTTRVPVHGRLQ